MFQDLKSHLPFVMNVAHGEYKKPTMIDLQIKSICSVSDTGHMDGVKPHCFMIIYYANELA